MEMKAHARGNIIVIKNSTFMEGKCVFELPKGMKLPSYIEPNDKFPNGDAIYEKYNKAWMMSIGINCTC